MTLAELLALLANLGELTDEQLADLRDQLRTAAADRREQPATDELVAELTSIADAIEQVRAEEDSRAESAAQLDAQAQAALERINSALADPDDPDGGEADGGADGGDGDEGAAGTQGDEGAAPTPAEPAQPEGAQPVPVAAGAAPARAPRVSRVNARRPASMQVQPPPAPRERPLNLVAAANAPGFAAGEPIQDAGKLADLFEAGIKAFKGYTGNDRTEVRLVRTGPGRAFEDLDATFGGERVLTADTRENLRKINRAQAQLRNGERLEEMQALAAAGGICVPQQVRYDLPIIGDDARPVRDQALMRFGADRGGISTIPPPMIEDLEDAIGIWTEANDQNPSSPTTKPCLTVDCPTEDDTLVDAITQCLRFGNFRARYFAEQIEAWMRLAAVNHARIAENRSLATIAAGSKDVNVGEGLGAVSDVLSTLDRAWAGWASRHRAPNQRFRFVLPFWFLAMARVDISRQIPGGGTLDERYAVADATIERWINARNVSVTWHFDGEAGQIFGPQGDGPLQGWPDTVVSYLYEEGAWLFLDGGELNLGLVRDSSLNEVNDVQVFSETFEATHFHGIDSWRIEMDVCPNGTTSGTTDFDPCSTGS